MGKTSFFANQYRFLLFQLHFILILQEKMLQFDFIGRLHPLIVHIPIGILLFAFALILVQRVRRVKMETTICLALLWGSISAVAACVAGWILAQSGEYDADLVFKHQWTGIATAVLGLAAYFIKPIRLFLATATVAALVVAGHYGGTLTHGADYLFPKKKTPAVKIDSILKKTDINQTITNQPVATLSDTAKAIKSMDKKGASKIQAAPIVAPIIQKTFVYRDLVAPILENKCYNCHSVLKKKGGLRLDTEEFIKEGGKNGSILTVGNPENSPLYANLILPEEDDDHMPPQGKPQLTEQEIAIIHAWIKKGAPFSEVTETILANVKSTNTPQIMNISDPKPIKNVVAVAPKPNNTEGMQNTEAKILSTKTEAANPALLSKLKQQNIIISDFGEGSNYLMANFVNVKNYNSNLIVDLKGIDKQLVRLKLSNLPVSDNDLNKLATFKNLTRLNLDKTAVTDAGLASLKSLPNLEQLNLYGTNITDKGLVSITQCPNLKIIYLWQTKVTAAGVEQLKKALPNLQIEMGGFKFPKPDTSKLKSTEGG